MSFRTVVVTKHCKCSYKNGYLLVRDTETVMIHLSEIYVLILDTTAVSITSHLVNEMISQKIPIIFCDEKHNPVAELLPLYGSHNTSKRVREQVSWREEFRISAWTQIVAEKIKKQAEVLNEFGLDNSKLIGYLNDLHFGDVTNREGLSAKVYFNLLFGKGFTREVESITNAALDYGYSILLSTFNKEIIALGYVTQLGLCHRNEYNQYNLASDLMEPFRPIIDRLVYKIAPTEFNHEVRSYLIGVLNEYVEMKGVKLFLPSAIRQYVQRLTSDLSRNEFIELETYSFV